jgi:hypothetical protein
VRFLLSLLACLLSAYATPRWVKPEASKSDLAQDQAACVQAIQHRRQQSALCPARAAAIGISLTRSRWQNTPRRIVTGFLAAIYGDRHRGRPVTRENCAGRRQGHAILCLLSRGAAANFREQQ